MSADEQNGHEAYMARVMAEIDDEVRRRRTSGEFPPSFERRLDLLFERFAPVGARDDHFKESLKQTDRHAYIDIDVPIQSDKPAARYVKLGMRGLMAWYLNYLVQQITRFTASLMRVMHMVGQRLDQLEELTKPLQPPPAGEGDLLSYLDADVHQWTDLVVDELAGAKGRVLHCECGEGVLVSSLATEGLDVYGVDPRPELLDKPVSEGLDVRMESPLQHIEATGDQSLGGMVVSGFVNRVSIWGNRQLASLAAQKLKPGAKVIVIGTTPNAWARNAPAVESDLAPGRPLHAETWAHLLRSVGFAAVEAHHGPASGDLEAVGADVPGAEALNANLARINGVLFGPDSFAVVARRAS